MKTSPSSIPRRQFIATTGLAAAGALLPTFTPAAEKAVRERSQPVATITHARDALLACLLIREAVYRGTAVTMKDIGA